MTDQRLLFQRDLYRLLLSLQSDQEAQLRYVLDEALRLIVAIAGAAQGYIEVRHDDDEVIYSGHSLEPDELDTVRLGISSGIIKETLDSGETILTPSAMFDPRFTSRESVQDARIQAVFCAPLKGNVTRGVLYLQGDFQTEDHGMVMDARFFSDHVSPFLDQLLVDVEEPAARSPMAALRRRYEVSEVVGSSDVIHEVLRSAMMVAPLDATVLLTGSSGTGKTQIARVIHANSGRVDGPFVEVNCAALPETLIENELFGSVKGAHSEARQDSLGKVTAAHGGTLLLDEIGALPLGIQGKLLQFLQSGEFYPLGSAALTHSDARIICATHIDLQEAVASGLFREDLYYRINTFPIQLPDLATRGDDILELADRLCRLACAKYQFPMITISRAGKQFLRGQDWPGNIRELAHLLESACIRAAFDEKTVLGVEELRRGDLTTDQSAEFDYMNQTFQEATQAFQASFLETTLARHDGNVSETARQLKISRTHLHHLIKQFDIKA